LFEFVWLKVVCELIQCSRVRQAKNHQFIHNNPCPENARKIVSLLDIHCSIAQYTIFEEGYEPT
jgi:hypothetical protein